MEDWLEVERAEAPLLVTFPHTGDEIPRELERGLVSAALARLDTDWWVHRLYGFAHVLGATTVRTKLSRSVIDVNRDPEGRSLYPGQATTQLCPTTTFDGVALYTAGHEPDTVEIGRRRMQYFERYHATVAAEIERLRKRHPCVVLYDAHSIRSRVPRLFEGELPHFNIGTNGGATCASALAAAVETVCDASPFGRVTNGRFKGGWTTRHYGRPQQGIHAIQMELACRSYLDESQLGRGSPPDFDPARAAPVQSVLGDVLQACLAFASSVHDEGC